MNEPMFRLDQDRFGVPRRRFAETASGAPSGAEHAAKSAPASAPAKPQAIKV